MSVLLLGASGFLGSWAARALVASGADTIALVRPSSDLWRIDTVRELVVVRESTEHWVSVLDELKPTTVLSLEWAGVAGADRDAPEQWKNLDRFGTVVDGAIGAGVARFIGVGSQAEYGPRSDRITETAPLGPVTEYGRAKVAAARLLRERAEESGMEWVWARVFSTFGPLDHPHWMIPQLAAAMLRGERLPLTDGTQMWSYLSGADAGTAFAALATSPGASGPYNVGHPDAPQLRETVERFAARLAAAAGGPGLDAQLDFGAIPHGPSAASKLEPDVTRLAALGWSPRIPLEDGLAMTASWLTGHEVADPLRRGQVLPAKPK